MRILVLDDDQIRLSKFKHKYLNDDVDCVETSKDAINKLDTENYDCLFLDHDLGGEVYVDSGENTGYEVAKWLADNPQKQPKIIFIHSLNPIGSENMKQLLPRAVKKTFAWI
jgi:CheY-like chemotaxis protein